MKMRKFFSNRAISFLSAEKALEKESRRYSLIRIVAFVIALVLFVFFANARQGALVTIIVVFIPLIFGAIVSRHNKLIDRLNLNRNLRIINEQETGRLDHAMNGIPDGSHWKDKQHPYASDLDIFGQNSLYQMLNRTSTPSGDRHLAEWLLEAGTEKDIAERQEAVKELSADVDWNQTFQASGNMLEENEQANLDRLIKWIQSPAKLPRRHYRIMSYLNAIVFLVTVVLTIFGLISIYVPLAILLVNGVVIKNFQAQLSEVTQSASGNAQLLRSYAALIGIIEQREFSSGLLKHLREPFMTGRSATTKILSLRKLVDYLNARGNLFYQLFNFAFLFDIHLIAAMERWKRNNRDDISYWFSNIGIYEALISLAGFKIANPDFEFPSVTGGSTFNVQALGHPLIQQKERVVNDFKMEGPGKVLVITGSNMSGKSTFLRTVGINAVLAYAGSVVCASFMQLSAFRVFTGMRTEDNLEEHISSFYAELRRIRQLLDYIKETDIPVLYMLDEVLKGTNTKDRHSGAEALIRKLSATTASGFVSTHDIELGQLASENDAIENFSFNSEIRDNEIIFDYKIEKGICHSFNASMLMKKIGILDDPN